MNADAFTGTDAKKLSEVISLDRAAGTVGAAILRRPQTGTTGHIVITDGAGGMDTQLSKSRHLLIE
jgi:hypothetical protein